MKNDCYVNPLVVAEEQHGHSPSYQELRNWADGKQGFTMIEILVVVVIVAIMATATGGLYMGTFKNMQLEKSAKEIYLAAKYARLAAVEKQINCQLALDKEEGRFFVTYKETDEETQEEYDVVVSNPYTKPVTLPDGVTFEEIMIVRSVTINNALSEEGGNGQNYEGSDDEEMLENVIVFSPFGTADSAVIKIGNGRTSYTVSVSPATGKVKIVRGETEIPLDIIDLDEEEN